MEFGRASGRFALIAALILAGGSWPAPLFVPSHGLEAAPAGATLRIDHTHLEAFREPTWVEVELPASRVTLRSIRVLTAKRSWMLEICGSTQDPATCSVVAGDPARRAPGWRGDFLDSSLDLDYTDLEQRSTLHLRVTPMGGGWMIFRVQIEARR